MINKNKILDSWIMVEHLSEGNIDKGKKEFLKFDELENENFYLFFNEKIKEKNFQDYSKAGLVIYFDIFNFECIINFLRKEYNLEKGEEDIEYGDKFSFALYFDKELNFDSDKTFFTVSGYIRYVIGEYIQNFKKIPEYNDLRKYEKNFREELVQYFDILSGETEQVQEKFNNSLKKVFNKFKIGYENCRFQILNNLEIDATHLHSFFIEDLNIAKKIDTVNLSSYLFGGEVSKRVNLDSKNDSKNFNPNCFKEILQPECYPLGRFPSNTKYALSFMQQVAVNLAIGYDKKSIRSVNGPPGTGKTTLLKDIFAELVVRQSYDISNMKNHKLEGSDKTRYYDNAKIGELPEQITENSIVVASSNNGAVQNIVNELPLIKDIDNNLQEELKEADYFYEISNNIFDNEWLEDENGNRRNELLKRRKSESNNFWGLFSLEGGKSENITRIMNYIKAIIQYFEEEYEANNKVYDEFKEQYKKVEMLRNEARKMIEIKEQYESVFIQRENFNSKYENEYKDKISKQSSLEKEIFKNKKEQENLKMEQNIINKKNEDLEASITNWENLLQEKKKNKPCFLNFSKKREYRKEIEDTLKNILKLKNEKDGFNEKEFSMNEKIKKISYQIQNTTEDLEKHESSFKQWEEAMKQKMTDLTAELNDLSHKKNKFQSKLLDMSSDYTKLQMSNPWFDEEFRIAQSKLFISALKVRKEFLYENRKNLKAAIIIWDKQKEYLENKVIIEIAWNWINLAIPVISSTFASFSRMCNNLGIETLGSLFIDEAGQAIPQAAVGAIFRSRHVMLVGDPSQIKPVLTLESSVLNLLRKNFGISEKYLSESVSAQTLADVASQYGFYRDVSKSKDSWIGIPLWVHRRCQYPMFTISNEISYNGFMVQGTEGNGKVEWHDIKGKAQDKFVKEQSEFLKKEIKKRLELDSETSIYVITPFRNIATKLAEELKDIKFTKYENNKPMNVGTIHTFQGKAANVVYLVLGADSSSIGAATWAVKEANMMNVAATRAKKEFYIIADKKLYSNIGSDVVRTTINVINSYKENHPEVYELNTQGIENDGILTDNNLEDTPSCPLCGEKMKIRVGKYGKFWGCSNYPICNGTKSYQEYKK